MAVTYKEDGSRSGKRAAIYRGVAEQVGHGISRSRKIRGVTDHGQGSGMKTQNRTGIENSLRGGWADIGHNEHGQSELAARLEEEEERTMAMIQGTRQDVDESGHTVPGHPNRVQAKG
eukprot:CAMPEP_0201870836 /NCGR_PEP_ID=MMETSP0902-20130614/3887_1 /ASSEMBLY_ACC=CAM_ASM_000551 /TAXON_ID=420261 /ORGANISM="Thalassiosira antarctica, Strain CCMP982" /LENGTH=117 /DNA_ID=CAMNT_0048396623 /DNA_START=140 /DNA_END=494 /DNA_ORIENTATION=-